MKRAKGKSRIASKVTMLRWRAAQNQIDVRNSGCCPDEGWIKLNTDAGFCPSSGVASTGLIARDDEGSVLLTMWRSLRNYGLAKEAEVEACLQGLRLIFEWIGKPAQVESDCSNLIHDLAKEADNKSAWAGVL
jgi:hypothetical protein